MPDILSGDSMQGINYRPITPISFLERSAREFPDRTAVVDHQTRLRDQKTILAAIWMLRGARTPLPVDPPRAPNPNRPPPPPRDDGRLMIFPLASNWTAEFTWFHW